VIVNDGTLTPAVDRRSYLVGFALALALTVVPFAVVYWSLLPVSAAITVIALAAIVQIVVQLRYFLHIDFRQTPRENIMALLFAGFLILVMVGGSLWIMFDLHYRHRLDTAALLPSAAIAHGGCGVASSPPAARVTKNAATSRISPTSIVTVTAA
jgi:cytochrome o ubiquinol oxidase operon protein cyoD